MEEVLAGRYELGAELGRGGMASVRAARDLRLRRPVAVKLLPSSLGPPDPTLRQRFVREAQSAASFTHPHAVTIFDAGDADGVLYLVMELVDGESLTALLARRGRLGVEESRRLAGEVLQALGAAHRAGIVHRDVKPSNVLITTGGSAKLADFGIAKRLDDLTDGLTRTGTVVGTPTYLAPEQAAGESATPATDIYATGVVLFEMLAGRPPFVADTPIATAIAHRDAPVPDVRERRADVPAAVAAAVSRAMAKRPADRFATAEEMGAALVSDRPVGATIVAPPTSAPLAPTAARPVSTEVMPSGPRRPTRAWWWLALLVAAAVTATVVAAAGDEPGPAPTAVVPPAPTVPVTPAPTVAPTTATLTAASVAEVIALLDADAARFGPRADQLRRDLARIESRDGDQRARDVERLDGRLTEWTDDGSLAPEVAELVRSVLPAGDGGAGGDGDEDDDDD